MDKESKHCKSVDDLKCTDTVKHKAKDYVKKYMGRYGTNYKPETTNSDKGGISPKDTLSQDGSLE